MRKYIVEVYLPHGDGSGGGYNIVRPYQGNDKEVAVKIASAYIEDHQLTFIRECDKYAKDKKDIEPHYPKKESK